MNDALTKDLRKERAYLLRLKAEVAALEANTTQQLRARRVGKLRSVICQDHAWMVDHHRVTDYGDRVAWGGPLPHLIFELEWDSFEQLIYSVAIQGIRATSTLGFVPAVETLKEYTGSLYERVLDHWLTLDRESPKGEVPPTPEEARILPQKPGEWWARWKGGEPRIVEVWGLPGGRLVAHRAGPFWTADYHVDVPHWKWLMPHNEAP